MPRLAELRRNFTASAQAQTVGGPDPWPLPESWLPPAPCWALEVEEVRKPSLYMAFCLMSSWTFTHLIQAVFLAWEVTEVA